MSDRPEISVFMKWRDLCEQLKKEGKEAGRDEDRGLIAAILTFAESSSDLLPWRAMCDLLKKEGGKEAGPDGVRGQIAAMLLLAAQRNP